MRRFIASILYAFADLLDPPAEPIQSLVWQPGQGELPAETWRILKGGWDMPEAPFPHLVAYARESFPDDWQTFWGRDNGTWISDIPYPFARNSRPDDTDFEALGFEVMT